MPRRRTTHHPTQSSDPSQPPAPRRAGTSAADPALAELTSDLAQPLASIAALASAGRSSTGLPDHARQLFDDILAEARRASAICRGARIPRPRAVELRAFAEDAALRARARFGADVTVTGEDVTLAGDPAGWRATLGGLLDDACRAAGTSGLVEVTIATGTEELVLEVADSGSAYRSGGDVTTAGLAMAQRLAEHHGGRLTVGQSELGGASVRIVLPAPPPAAPPP